MWEGGGVWWLFGREVFLVTTESHPELIIPVHQRVVLGQHGATLQCLLPGPAVLVVHTGPSFGGAGAFMPAQQRVLFRARQGEGPSEEGLHQGPGTSAGSERWVNASGWACAEGSSASQKWARSGSVERGGDEASG